MTNPNNYVKNEKNKWFPALIGKNEKKKLWDINTIKYIKGKKYLFITDQLDIARQKIELYNVLKEMNIR